MTRNIPRRFLHRIFSSQAVLTSTRLSGVFYSGSSNQHQLANFFGDNKPFSSSSIFKSEMAKVQSGEGDVNDLNMNYEELLDAQKDDSVLIIDVREQSEIDKTVREVANALANLSYEAFKDKYNKQSPTKFTKLVFSCMSGRRSAAVRDEIQKLGYKNAYNYTGGWSEWECKQKCL